MGPDPRPASAVFSFASPVYPHAGMLEVRPEVGGGGSVQSV